MPGSIDLFVDELYLAGQHVPAGLYREIGSRREVRMDAEGTLPASLDGRIAAYVCVRYTWDTHLRKDAEAEKEVCAVPPAAPYK